MSQIDRVIDHFLNREGCGVAFVGEMFANKTGSAHALYQEMVKWSRISPKKYGHLIYLFFKPEDDARYGNIDKITNHDGTINIQASQIPRDQPENILEIVKTKKQKGKEIGAITIDEAWSFDDRIVEVYSRLIDMDLVVIITLLNTYFNRDPIPVSGKLLCYSEYVIIKHAICIPCAQQGINNKRSRFSFRIDEIWKNHEDKRPKPANKGMVNFGGAQKYFAACRKCYLVLNQMIEQGIDPDAIIEHFNLYDHFKAHGAL